MFLVSVLLCLFSCFFILFIWGSSVLVSCYSFRVVNLMMLIYSMILF